MRHLKGIDRPQSLVLMTNMAVTVLLALWCLHWFPAHPPHPTPTPPPVAEAYVALICTSELSDLILFSFCSDRESYAVIQRMGGMRTGVSTVRYPPQHLQWVIFQEDIESWAVT